MRNGFALALFLGAAMPALANDGFGGLSATGLKFDQTESVEMVEEKLFIGIDKVKVDYVFRNNSESDVTGEVIFPLPPVAVWDGWVRSMNLPDDLSKADIVDFTAMVDGKPVRVTIDKVAVIEEPWEENRPLAEQYDTPGRDVTAELKRFGLPLTLDWESIGKQLLALSPEDQAAIKSAGLADYLEADAGQDVEPEALGKWSIVTRYHWNQTFPAGAEVRISHSYTNRPPGGLFVWTHPPEYERELIGQYCIDDATSKGMAKALKGPGGDESQQYGTSYRIDYVLRTANSWAGPIGTFTLTLDKGKPGNIISLCIDGVKKTGPTTFVVEKKNFTPDRDLQILIVDPSGNL